MPLCHDGSVILPRTLAIAPVPAPDAEAAVPRVSLVLPVHNGAEYLDAAIASICAQSFADFELICVDDASVDASPQILATAAAADSRLRIIRLDTNVGLPTALNRGFAAARGSYFSWTSDDNLLRVDMLEKLVAALHANADVDIAHSDYSVIDPAGKLVERVSTDAGFGLLSGNHVGASFLYRRAVDFALGGYDSDLFGAEDYDFWLRASAHFRFLHVPEDLYLYRKHPRSLTNSRAAAIQTLTTNVVLRAIPAGMKGRPRANVLIGLFRRNYLRLRLDLLLRAATVSPLAVLAQLPSLVWHGIRVVRTRIG